MKTIEERAHDYGTKRAGGHYQGGTKGMIYEGSKQRYTEIANEQKQIDIEQSCEWWNTKLNGLLPNELLGQVVDEYRKSMEEE